MPAREQGWSLAETVVSLGLLAVATAILFLAMERIDSRLQASGRQPLQAAAILALLNEIHPAHPTMATTYSTARVRLRRLADGSDLYYRRRITCPALSADQCTARLMIYADAAGKKLTRQMIREIAPRFRGWNLGQNVSYYRDARGRVWSPSRQPFRAQAAVSGWLHTVPPQRYTLNGGRGHTPMTPREDAPLLTDGEQGRELAYAFTATQNASYRLTLGVAEGERGVRQGMRAMRVVINGADVGLLDAMPSPDSPARPAHWQSYRVTPRISRGRAILWLRLVPAPGATHAPRLACVSLEKLD